MKSKACCKVSPASLKALVRRQPWLYTLWFLSFFFSMPVIAAMQLGEQAFDIGHSLLDYQWTREFLTQLLGHQHPLLYAIIPAGAFVTVMCLFSYLHSRRQIDFFHSQPIPRGQMFTERVLAGLLVMLVPYLINIALTLAVALVLGFGSCIPWLAIIKGLLWTVGFYLGIFSVFLIGSLLTGQSAVNVLLSLFLAGVGPALIGLFYACVNTFYDNAYTALWNIEGPLAYTNPLLRYWFKEVVHLGSVDAAYLLLFTVLALGCGYWLFLNRPSEGAEQALAFRIARLPIKLPLAICATLGLAALFYVINYRTFWWYFGGLIGAFLCCQIYEIIYATDFRGGARRFKELALVLVVFMAASVVMWNDATGFNSRLPELDKVTKVELQLAGFDTYSYNYRMLTAEEYQGYQISDHIRARYNLAQWPVTSEEGIAAAYSIVQKALAAQEPNYHAGYSSSLYRPGVVVTETFETADYEKRAEYEKYQDAQYAATGFPTDGPQVIYSSGDYKLVKPASTQPYDPSVNKNYGRTTTVGVRFTLENGKTLERFYHVMLPLGQIREELAIITNDPAYIAAHYDIFEVPGDQIRLVDISSGAIGNNEKSERAEQDMPALANVPAEYREELLATYRAELLSIDTAYRAKHLPVGTLNFRIWDADPGTCIWDAKQYGTYWTGGAYNRTNLTYPIYECMTGTIALLEQHWDYPSALFQTDLSTAQNLEVVCYSSDYYGKEYPLEALDPFHAESIQLLENIVAMCGTPDADGNIWIDGNIAATYHQDNYNARLVIYSQQIISALAEEAQLSYYNEHNNLFVSYPELEMCYNYTLLSGSMDGQWLLIPYGE